MVDEIPNHDALLDDPKDRRRPPIGDEAQDEDLWEEDWDEDESVYEDLYE